MSNGKTSVLLTVYGVRAAPTTSRLFLCISFGDVTNCVHYPADSPVLFQFEMKNMFATAPTALTVYLEQTAAVCRVMIFLSGRRSTYEY